MLTTFDGVLPKNVHDIRKNVIEQMRGAVTKPSDNWIPVKCPPQSYTTGSQIVPGTQQGKGTSIGSFRVLSEFRDLRLRLMKTCRDFFRDFRRRGNYDKK